MTTGHDDLGDVEYLSKIPTKIPDGQVVVHNHVRPTTRRLGSRGFRAWLAEPNERLVVCDCGWAPELGEHYRSKFGATVIENYVPSDTGWGIVVGRLREPPSS
jgi:hypothetical protein